MDTIRRILSTEAILFTRAITSGGALLIAFGVPITDADVNSAVEITASLLVAGNLIAAIMERRAVFSQRTHSAEIADAYAAGMEVGASPNRNTF